MALGSVRPRLHARLVGHNRRKKHARLRLARQYGRPRRRVIIRQSPTYRALVMGEQARSRTPDAQCTDGNQRDAAGRGGDTLFRA